MALSPSEAREIYTWLSASWPTVIKPGAGDEFVRVKLREIAKDFQAYTKDEVLAGIDRWRQNNEKYPSTKNLINEVEWLRRQKAIKRRAAGDSESLWPMLIIDDDGYEACYGQYVREAFVNHPMNIEKLEPEEWLRRFQVRKGKIIEKLREAREAANGKS